MSDVGFAPVECLARALLPGASALPSGRTGPCRGSVVSYAHPAWPSIEPGRLPLCQLSYSRPRRRRRHTIRVDGQPTPLRFLQATATLGPRPGHPRHQGASMDKPADPATPFGEVYPVVPRRPRARGHQASEHAHRSSHRRSAPPRRRAATAYGSRSRQTPADQVVASRGRVGGGGVSGRSRTRRRSCALAATMIVERLMAMAPTAIEMSMPHGTKMPIATGIATRL